MSRPARSGGWAAAWLLRLSLAAILLVCSEVLWWSNDPLHYTAPEWAGLAGIYLALAALMLDLLARFRVTDVLGLLVVAGLYGLLNGALIAHSAFTNFPISLVARPLGLHALGGGVLGLMLWLWLLDGRGLRPGRAIVLAGVGLAWGIWVRWFPLLESNGFPLPELPTALILAALGWLVAGGLTWTASRRASGIGSDERLLCLRPWEWLPVGGGLLVAFLIGARQGAIATFDGVALGLLAGYMIAVLFFLRGRRGHPLLARVTPSRPVAWPVWLACGALLILPAAVGYALPGQSPDGPPLQLLTAALTGFGVAWLPGVSLAAGLRAYVRLFRQGG